MIKNIPSAGTADWITPGNFYSQGHMENDVAPYNLAVEFNEVKDYYDVRPHVYMDEAGNVYVNNMPTTKNYTQKR